MDNDILTEEEFKQYIDEIKYWMDVLKEHGIKDVRFTCKEAEDEESNTIK